jgi:hypothetical protein
LSPAIKAAVAQLTLLAHRVRRLSKTRRALVRSIARHAFRPHIRRTVQDLGAGTQEEPKLPRLCCEPSPTLPCRAPVACRAAAVPGPPNPPSLLVAVHSIHFRPITSLVHIPLRSRTPAPPCPIVRHLPWALPTRPDPPALRQRHPRTDRRQHLAPHAVQHPAGGQHLGAHQRAQAALRVDVGVLRVQPLLLPVQGTAAATKVKPQHSEPDWEFSGLISADEVVQGHFAMMNGVLAPTIGREDLDRGCTGCLDTPVAICGGATHHTIGPAANGRQRGKGFEPATNETRGF